MKLGQSLVLSGIRTQSQRKGTAGVPLLSDIPLLGALFGTRTQAREDVEGAVFIIPSVVESAPRDAMEMVNDAISQYTDYAGDMEEVNAYNKRPSLDGKPPSEPKAKK
jgi:pilus assembly protein CpaC